MVGAAKTHIVGGMVANAGQFVTFVDLCLLSGLGDVQSFVLEAPELTGGSAEALLAFTKVLGVRITLAIHFLADATTIAVMRAVVLGAIETPVAELADAALLTQTAVATVSRAIVGTNLF